MERTCHKWTWAWYLLAGALVVCDQVVKGWVRATMALGESRPLIPHLVELLYVENTGAAFSLLNRCTWLLAVLSAGVTVVLVLAIWRDWLATTPFSRLCLALVLAGAAGNLIDRAGRGRVTDMFNFTFVTFGVFNVADICVVGGVLGYAAWLLLAQGKSAAGPADDTDHGTHADRPG